MLTHSKAPVYSHVYWSKENILRKNVHLASPSFHSCVATLHHSGVKKCIENVDFRHAFIFTSRLNQIEVKVDDLE